MSSLSIPFPLTSALHTKIWMEILSFINEIRNVPGDISSPSFSNSKASSPPM